MLRRCFSIKRYYIHTYSEYNKNNFRFILNRYRDLLLEAGFSNVCRKQKIDKLLWYRADKRFINIINDDKWNQMSLNSSYFNVKAIAHVWNPEYFKIFKNMCMEMDILINGDDILDLYTNRLNKEASEFIGTVASLFSNHFIDMPIFFTNEKGNIAISKLMLQFNNVKYNSIWNFELAIVPLSLEYQFIERPNTYIRIQLNNKLIFAKINLWDSLSEIIFSIEKFLLY